LLLVSSQHPEDTEEEGDMLQVQLASKAFLTRLKTVTPFAGRRWPKPILETVQFEATAERRGLLRATDLEAFVAIEVPLLKVITPGRVQLPRDKLCRILKEANGGTVTLEEVAPESVPITTQPVTTPTRCLAVHTGKSTVTFPTFDPAHFPERPLEETTGTITLPSFRLVRAVQRTAFATDPASTRYALGGLGFEFADGVLSLTGSDGHCLSHAVEPATGQGLTPAPSITVGEETKDLAPGVSARALSALSRLLETLETSLTLGFTEAGQLQIEGKGLFFTARQLEGRFPPWRDVAPPPGVFALQVDDPSRLLQAMKSAQAMTTRECRGMELRLHRYTLTLRVGNQEGTSELTVPVRNLSDDLDAELVVTVDPTYLVNYLALQKGVFTCAFPREKGQSVRCTSDGWVYLFMTMEEPAAPAHAEAAGGNGVPETSDEEPPAVNGVPETNDEEPPASEPMTHDLPPPGASPMATQKPRGKRRNNVAQPAHDRPVKVIRVRNVRGNIWANHLPSGATVYNVTFDRLWKEDDETDAGGQVVKPGAWKQSASFRKDDLLLLGKIADLAHTWVDRRIQDESRPQSF
jgi:DNA polymerase-3 subunit beta